VKWNTAIRIESKDILYVDDGESDMLKRDGKCFTNYNIDKGNYM